MKVRVTREGVFNTIGVGLLVLCFVVALARVMFRAQRESDPGLVTLRFAHWQLEGGVRDAMDVLSREYEQLRAAEGVRVRVEQMAVPERVYPNWVITQLVGGTEPDLIQLGMGTSDERIARYFEPLTRLVDEPNAFNRGTPLEGRRWRETFIDGLESPLSYNPALLEYYGIPLSLHTIRIFYNVPLYRKIAGETPTPTDYNQFLQLCRRVREYGEANRRALVPVAGSKYNAPYLMGALYGSQTQRLMLESDRAHQLRTDDSIRGLAYLDGRWDFDHPAVRSGLALMREVAREMQPGFLQVAREDATVQFVQGRSLMIATGSWDASSFRVQADFEIGVFELPLPTREHPVYGQFVLGPVSEAGTGTGLTFGLTRNSANREEAIRFLQYLGSLPASRRFAEVSGWLPAVVGVDLPPQVRPFQPLTDGYPPGFNIATPATLEAMRAYDRHFYLLLQGADASAFVEAMKRDYPGAVLQDLWASDRGRLRAVQRNDTTAAALSQIGRASRDAEHERKQAELTESQFGLELGIEQARWRLEQLGHPPARP